MQRDLTQCPELYCKSSLSTVSILDQSGRVVQTNEVNSLQSYSLNVQSIENGVYYIRIENEGRKLILKFVKSNN